MAVYNDKALLLSLKPKNDDTNKKQNSDTKENNDDCKMDVNVDNTCIDWWLVPNKNHRCPRVNTDLPFKFEDYDAYYVGDTSKKVLYLTFDEGYENGYTDEILDILKENDVKAIFFVTLPYIKDNPDIIKRMADEGHIVGNHTHHHPSMPEVATNEEKFNKEFSNVEDLYKEITGSEMPKFFRPPMGKYSERSLAMTKNLGYKTVFWSFAYHDWEINKQPDPQKAKTKILSGLHDGSIILLHAVSKTNTEILDEVLKDAKKDGYTFELLE
ncbi:MAG: delta-lactam-biosynthetic de-N-acetylase [Clostridium sp.]